MTLPSANLCLRLLFLPLLLFHFSGCGVLILGGAAAGTAGYVSGDLNATVDGGFQSVIDAADSAIRENSITQVSKDVTLHSAVYELRTLQDDKIILTINRATRDLTNITIRVGVFGDEPLSHNVLKEIETRVK